MLERNQGFGPSFILLPEFFLCLLPIINLLRSGNRGSSLLLRVSCAGMEKQSADKCYKKWMGKMETEFRQQQIGSPTLTLKLSSPLLRRLPPVPLSDALRNRRALFEPGELARSLVVSVRSIRSDGRGVNGFGAFCRNKRSSPAGTKPGNTEHYVETRNRGWQ